MGHYILVSASQLRLVGGTMSYCNEICQTHRFLAQPVLSSACSLNVPWGLFFGLGFFLHSHTLFAEATSGISCQ